MKTKFLLALILAISSTCGAFAQLVNFQTMDGRPIVLPREKGFDGTAYLSEEYKQTTVVLMTGDSVSEKLSSRLNVLKNTLEYKIDNEIYEIDFNKLYRINVEKPNEGKSLYMNGKLFGLSNQVLPEVIVQGDLTLLKANTKKLKEQAVNTYTASTKVKVVTDTEEYYVFSQGQAKQIKKNKKAFINALPENYRTKAEAISKELNTNWKNEEDLALLVARLN